MKQVSYCLFETPLGWCGIAWSEGPNPGTPYAVTSLQLPEATAGLTESRIAQNSGAVNSSEPPLQVINITEYANTLRVSFKTFVTFVWTWTRQDFLSEKCARPRAKSRWDKLSPTPIWLLLWVGPMRRAPWVALWGGTPFLSSSPAIESLPLVASPEDFPLMEAARQRRNCSPSKAPWLTCV
jgi:hypothetical protein